MAQNIKDVALRVSLDKVIAEVNGTKGVDEITRMTHDELKDHTETITGALLILIYRVQRLEMKLNN